MIFSLFFAAQAQTITGGLGAGAFAGMGAIERFGWTTNVSIEVVQLTEEIPWLGVGAESVVGFVPKYCTNCNIKGTLRVGAGPIIKQRNGFLLVGARYSILGDTSGVRPFAITKMLVPATRMEFRPFLWLEGLRSTEVGIGLELGFKITDKTFVIRESKPGSEEPATATEEPTIQTEEPANESETPAPFPTEAPKEPGPDIE